MRLTVNGETVDTQSTGLHSLRASLYPGSDCVVTILDGYQTDEDLPLYEAADVLFIQKGKLPPQELLERMLVARHTPGVYEKVKKARVAVAGLGGLGSAIALSLARTGVGHLHLVDFDVVEPSNLNRQQYAIRHLGMAKAEALRQQIEEINPYVRVTGTQVRVTEANVPELFAGDPILCEAFDRPDQKAMLVNTALSRLPRITVVAASGMAGSDTGNTIRTRRAAKRLYLCGDGHTGAETGRGLMAPRVGICAGHQANTVLRLILGQADES